MSAQPVALPEPRDYAAEYLAAFEKAVPADGRYVLPVLVRELNDRLREEDPDLLRGWLIDHLDVLAVEWFGHITRSQRARALSRRGSTVFAAAAQSFAEGNADALDSILDAPYTVGREVMPLRSMTAKDLTVAADAYEQIEHSNRFEKSFLRALAKQVGESTVGEALSAEKVLSIRAKLSA